MIYEKKVYLGLLLIIVMIYTLNMNKTIEKKYSQNVLRNQQHYEDEKCETFSKFWSKPSRITPTCVYFDLGAHHGDSYGAFIGSSDTDGKGGIFGNMFPNSTINDRKECDIHLIEGNVMFKNYLYNAKLQSRHPSRFFVYVPSLVYGKDTELTFYVNPGTKDKADCRNCGGALDSKHISSKNSGIKEQVNTVNLNRLLIENTLVEDHVIIKINIEGGEWPLIPCIAKSDSKYLIDELWIEVHTTDVSPTLAFPPNTREYDELRASMQKLEDAGVQIHEFGASCLRRDTKSKWCNI